MCFRNLKEAGSVVRWLLLGASVMLAGACGAGGDSGGGSPAEREFKIDLPMQLVHHQVTDGTLIAEAHLANGNVVELYIDPTTGAIQDRLRHNGTSLALEIVFLIDDGTSRTEVGRSTANLAWTDPLIPAEIVLATSDVQFLDFDQDGFTDLTELALGSDPERGDSLPMVSNRRKGGEFVLVDVMGSVSRREGPIVGESAGGDFTLN